jgi:hypothetical protein
MTAAPYEGETRVSAVCTALARAIPPEGLSLQELLARLGERGLLLLCILVTVPFLLLLSIPGSSMPFGVIIALNGIGLVTHRAPWLPGRLRHHRLAADTLFSVCARGCSPVLSGSSTRAYRR